MQLMQQRVQKSSRTMRPLRSARRSGPALLSQAVPPSISGALILSCLAGATGAATLGASAAMLWAMTNNPTTAPASKITPMAGFHQCVHDKQQAATGQGVGMMDTSVEGLSRGIFSAAF